MMMIDVDDDDDDDDDDNDFRLMAKQGWHTTLTPEE